MPWLPAAGPAPWAPASHGSSVPYAPQLRAQGQGRCHGLVVPIPSSFIDLDSHGKASGGRGMRATSPPTLSEAAEETASCCGERPQDGRSHPCPPGKAAPRRPSLVLSSQSKVSSLEIPRYESYRPRWPLCAGSGGAAIASPPKICTQLGTPWPGRLATKYPVSVPAGPRSRAGIGPVRTWVFPCWNSPTEIGSSCLPVYRALLCLLPLWERSHLGDGGTGIRARGPAEKVLNLSGTLLPGQLWRCTSTRPAPRQMQ